MSHFTVMVVADDQDELKKKLLPYHEYECTGIKQYTEFVIEHEAKDAKSAAEAIIADLNGEDLKARYKRYLNDGDLDSLFGDWSGLTRDSNGNYGRITNPNAKWDWWVVGGRWTGSLRLKNNASGINGEPGLMAVPNEDSSRADSAFVCDIDWDAIKKAKTDTVINEWNEFHEALDTVFDEPIPINVMDKAKEDFHADNERGKLHRETWDSPEDLARYNMAHKWATENKDAFWHRRFDEIKDLYKSLNEYGNMHGVPAHTYAFLDKENRWCQRGEMGWCGMDDPDKGTPDYDTAFWLFVESLKPTDRVWVVDCHI